jgi:hypothetical protein
VVAGRMPNPHPATRSVRSNAKAKQRIVMLNHLPGPGPCLSLAGTQFDGGFAPRPAGYNAAAGYACQKGLATMRSIERLRAAAAGRAE